MPVNPANRFLLSDADTMRPLASLNLIEERFGAVTSSIRDRFPTFRLALMQRADGDLEHPFVVLGLFSDSPITTMGTGLDTKSAAGYSTLEEANRDFLRLSEEWGKFGGNGLYWVYIEPLSE